VKVLSAAFLLLHFGFEIFLRKNISTKVEQFSLFIVCFCIFVKKGDPKMLAKLITGFHHDFLLSLGLSRILALGL
jgi:hypothetical protein